MLVSRNQLISYAIPADRYFRSRWERNSYFNGSETSGIYCAVADSPDVDMDDKEHPLWNLEQFNGVNWTLVSIDADSFALFVTNEGLKALTYVTPPSEAGYKCHITRVVVRETSLPQGADIINYNDIWFRYDSSSQGSNRNLTVLDTNDWKINPTFTLENNLTYRLNLANGGLQYMVLFDVDTLGLDYYSSSTTPPAKDTFTIGAVGLYVKDPEDENKEILFAIGNIANPIYKYASTATRVGNSIKVYLNTTLSNLGTVEDVKVMPEDMGSIPEVVSEDQLKAAWGDATTVPHNIYLIDNLYDTGIPALAVRTGNPAQGAIDWAYFSPVDSAISIGEIPVHSDVKDYMAVYYDGTQYIAATGTTGAQGIKIGNSILYNGKIVNSAKNYKYKIEIVPSSKGTGYSKGDVLYLENEGITIKVEEVTPSTGAVQTITWSPIDGDDNKSGTGLIPTTTTSTGLGLKVNLTSESNLNVQPWKFPSNWLNKPLYVSDSTAGTLTITPTETFIGWCTGTDQYSSIKLALDLRNYASYNEYGTTKYATSEIVRNGATDANKDLTSVTPSTLKDNYLQITQPNNATTISNPINVNTYVRFNHPILGAGSEFSGVPSIDENVVSFYGRSFRAQWGDLAEFYKSDRIYLPGTLITIGAGKEEITIADIECNGIISSEPGYTLGDKKDKYDLPVALTGKVPVRFAKDCDPQFGDRIYLSINEAGKASTIPHGKCLGKIIDKRKDLSVKSTIMCSVRIEF